jgi:fructose-1,6-bisphosphatase-3
MMDYSSAGKNLMEKFSCLPQDVFLQLTNPQRNNMVLDVIWYLWCGPCSPLFGKEKMTTFEQYFIEDKSTHKEPGNV